MSMFKKKLGTNGAYVAESQVDKALDLVMHRINTQQLSTSQVTRAALSMEAVSETNMHALNTAYTELSVAVESIATEMGISKNMTQAQKQSATAAGLLSGDPKAFLSQLLTFPKTATEENMSLISKDFAGDSVERRSYGMEAYDDRENRNAAAYSIVYNMQASRQDDFGETFFPTIVVTPDNVGFDVVARLMSVYNDVQRNISGALTNFNKTNIIRAIANPYVIQNDLTRIIPVYRTQSAANFVPVATIPSYNYSLDGQSIPTSPLATGVTFDLLALSQTDQLLASGVMDQTDSIDPDVTLTDVYLSVSSGGATPTIDLIKLNVENIPLSNFTYSTQNNYRVQTLNFNSTAPMLIPTTTQTNGSALVTLAAVATNNYTVRLNMALNGTCNIELGDTVVYGNNVSVYQITDASGNQVDLTTGNGLAIVTAFQNAKIIGYDLRAYRTNMNRRQRGQIVDVTYYTQRYNVPLRSPITAVRPVNSVDQTDAPYIQTLITATRVRLSNQAVTQLIASAQFLSQFVDARSAFGDAEGDNDPDLLGIGRFYVRPVYSQETVDMAVTIDSLTSSARAADIQAVLVNKIRDHAYRMYRDSEYPAAADALAGGKAPVPVVIVGTDPVLARYLTVTGDLRTLGGEFDVRIVSTLDQRVQGKIFITFGVFDENRNSTPNPLNFGNLAWSPELVMTVQITRNGAVSKETVVQPRFRFITNLPILSVLQVVNVPAVLNKNPIEFANVAAPVGVTTPPNSSTNYF